MPDESVYNAMFSENGLSRFGEIVSPDEVIQRALLLETNSISFTYNEPVVWFEFVYDTAVSAKENGLYVILVTNSYMTPEALETLAPYIDAYRVDIKSFSDDFYSRVCGAKLEPVLESAVSAKNLGIHVEVVTLLIPGQNDSVEEAKKASEWIVSNLGKETPVHLNAFRPHYKMENIKQTPGSTLEQTRAVYLNAGLEYVYIGNTISDFQNTYCPACNALLVSRLYSFGESVHLKRTDGGFYCSECGKKIPIFCPSDVCF